MDGKHNIERIAYSNIGIKEINAGYQVVGKTSGITFADEEAFIKAISNVEKIENSSGYAEALIEANGSVYFTNFSMTTDDNERPCPISSAVAADGVKWRELMRKPEKLIFCTRDYFLKTSPSEAKPGSPAELESIEALLPGRDVPGIPELRIKYGLDDDKYVQLITCVYSCFAAKGYEKMHIALPADMLTPENAREIIYCIYMILPAALRAQITYRLGALTLGTMITIGSEAGIRASRNYVDLRREDNKGFKCETLRGLSFCRDMLSHVGDEAFLSRMDEFIEEGRMYISPVSVNFNAETKKWGKNYLFAGAYQYASGKYAEYFKEEQTTAAFTMLSLCQMSTPRTSDSDIKKSWDSVVGNLLSEYGKHPLHTADSEGELRLDSGSVARITERGWHNLAYDKDEGSVIAAEFSNFVSSDDQRAAIFEKKCRENLKISAYCSLLADIYSPELINRYEKDDPSWWYGLRSDYIAAGNRNAGLELVIAKAYSAKDNEAKKSILDTADYSDHSLADEFLSKCDVVYAPLAAYERAEQFKRLIGKCPDLAMGLFAKDAFGTLSQEQKLGLLRSVFKSGTTSDIILETLNSDTFKALDSKEKCGLIDSLVSGLGGASIFDLIGNRSFTSLEVETRVQFFRSVMENCQEDGVLAKIFDSDEFCMLGDRRKALVREWVSKPRDVSKIQTLLSSRVFEELDPYEAGDVMSRVFENNRQEQQFRSGFICSPQFSGLTKEKQLDLTKLFFAEPVSRHYATSVINSDTFRDMSPDNRRLLYNAIIDNSSDEDLLTDVLCTEDEVNSGYALFSENVGALLPQRIHSDSNTLRVIKNAGMAILDSESRSRILRETAKGRNSSFYAESLESRSVLNADDACKKAIVDEAVASLISTDDRFIAENVFEGSLFNSLRDTDKAAVYTDYFGKRHSDDIAVKVISSPSFSRMPAETVAPIFTSVLAKMSEKAKGLALFNTEAFSKLGDVREKTFGSYILGEGSNEAVTAAGLNCKALEVMSKQALFSFASAAIEKYGSGFAERSLYPSRCFELLDNNDKLKLIDTTATSLSDYTSRVDSTYLAENLTKSKKLSDYTLKQIDPAENALLADALFNKLKSKFSNSSAPTEDLKRLYAVNPKLVRPFLGKLYNENGKSWRGYGQLADTYYSEIDFNPPRTRSAVKAELRKAESAGLTNYAAKLEKIIQRKTVPTVIVSAVAALAVLCGAFLFYVGPKLLSIDPLGINPHYEHEMLPTDNSRGFLSVGYDDELQDLTLYFANGDMYRFHNVPHKEYRALLSAPYPEIYYNRKIRGNYEYEPVTAAKRSLIPSTKHRDVIYEITRTPDSKGFIAIGYNEEEHSLKLFLRPEKVYVFYNVPTKVFRELMEAEDMGLYYNENIREEYKFDRID